MRHLIFVLIGFLMSPAWAEGDLEERSFTRLEREIDYLMAIWPGNYDNREQLQKSADQGRRSIEEGGEIRVHSIVRKVDLPDFGPHVLLLEEYINNNPEETYRLRLYELMPDEDENAVRVRMHFFREREKWAGTHADLSKLNELDKADTFTLDGCEILIRRESDYMLGAMEEKACIFGEDDNRRYADYQLRVGEESVWFRDRSLNLETDEPVVEISDFSWHIMERVRWFQCMIDFPREDGGFPNNTVDYVRIHDQGGTYPFTYRDGREMVFTFRNNWSYGMQRETLVVIVQEGDETGPTLVYGWADKKADWIGVNPGWIRLQCDLDTQQNREFQHYLRPDS